MAARAQKRAPFRQGLTPYSIGPAQSVEEACRIAAGVGADGIDFFSNPADWPLMREHGLVCSLYKPDPGGGVSELKHVPGPPGWNAIGLEAAQGAFVDEIHRSIDLAGDHGVPNILLLAGTRHEVSYEQGAANAVAFCSRVKDHAEQRGVTLVIELVNSKGQYGPPLSLFDHAEWGFDVVRQVGSPRVKVLYDCFHAQIMDGNIAATLRDNIDLIGHIHVAGVPGRHELDDNQELNYAFLAQVIAAAGYRGFVSHEWIPSPGADVLQALRSSIAVLDAGAAAAAI
jgi:hydroxypyruvate isomerase